MHDRHGNPTTGPRAEIRAHARTLLGIERGDDEALIAALIEEIERLRADRARFSKVWDNGKLWVER
jgi:uncharacterized small protein (DUF1192 family)